MANFITILRIAVTPVFVVAMARSDTYPSLRFLALGLFIFGALTDWLDGQVARRTGTVTEFGKTADPFADRIFIGAAVITLYAMRIIPLAFAVLVLGRDLIMLLGYPVIGKIDPTRIAVHWTGKLATAILFVAISVLILSPAPHTGSRVGFSGYEFASATSWQTFGLWFFSVGIMWSLVSAVIYISRALSLLAAEKAEGRVSREAASQ